MALLGSEICHICIQQKVFQNENFHISNRNSDCVMIWEKPHNAQINSNGILLALLKNMMIAIFINKMRSLQKWRC
jgi:hypothetical protein